MSVAHTLGSRTERRLWWVLSRVLLPIYGLRLWILSHLDRRQQVRNSTVAHAKILGRALLARAARQKHDVRIVSGTLIQVFWNDMVPAARNVLRRGARITCIVLNQSGFEQDGNEFYELLTGNEFRLSCKVIFLNKNVMDEPHFILVGESGYRYERENRIETALGDFNDPMICNYLRAVFDRLASAQGEQF